MRREQRFGEQRGATQGGGVVAADRDRRDVYTPKTGRAVTAVPEILDEEDTGMHVLPQDRKAIRSKRPTHARFERIEEKQDDHGEKLAAIAVGLADHGGKLGTIVDFMRAADDRALAEHNAAVERARLRAEREAADALAAAERAKVRAELDEKARERTQKVRLALIGILSTLAIAFAAWMSKR